jgi:hypothetical protein
MLRYWEGIKVPTNDKLFGFTAKITVTSSIGITAVLGIDTNHLRIGAIIYNNSANSVYMAYGSTVSTANYMTVIIPTFIQWVMPAPIYYGPLSFVRNAGSGTVMVTEILMQLGTCY